MRLSRNNPEYGRFIRAFNPPLHLRYPRIVRLMQFAACLSTSEAESCIRDFRDGRKWSGEAVNHFGGTRAVMDAVLRLRTNYRFRSELNGHWHSTCRECVPDMDMRQKDGFSVGGWAFRTKYDATQAADTENRQLDFGSHRQIVMHCTDRYCLFWSATHGQTNNHRTAHPDRGPAPVPYC